jgi:hypothetical protein
MGLYRAVSSLPEFSSARLTNENRVFVHPVCKHLDHYEVVKDWKLVGWCSAPFKNHTGGLAIVYEKLSPADEDSLDVHDHFEPGFYWGHGDPDSMFFDLGGD